MANRRHVAWAVAVACLAGCASDAPTHAPTPAAEPRPWPEAEATFHRDPRWLGGDAVSTLPVGHRRSMVFFGDTFVSTDPSLAARHRRGASRMPRNTIALFDGQNPAAAGTSFAWGRDADGLPASYVPDRHDRFYWPGNGCLDGEDRAHVFYYRMKSTPGEGLGFANDGYAVVTFTGIDGPLERWQVATVDAPPIPFDAVPATAVVVDGEWAIGLAIRQEGVHSGALMRTRIADLRAGRLGEREWWMGDARGWVAEREVGPHGPLWVLEDAGAECSLHFDQRLERWVHVTSDGFGATEIAVRTAPELTGPWSKPAHVYRPPESDGPRPLVYAAKAHPEWTVPGEDALVVTYATNSLEFADLFTEPVETQRYWPHVVILPRDVIPTGE